MEVSAICEWGPLGAVCHHKALSQAHGAAEPFWQPSTAGSWAQHGLQRGRAHMHSAVPSMRMWGITLLWSLDNFLSIF